MDELSATLLNRLVEKTFENMGQEERLAFIEKLFLDLPPAAQREFLLKLAQGMAAGTQPVPPVRDEPIPRMSGPPFMRRMMERGPPGFGPWQMCCRAMTDLVQAPPADTAPTALAARVFNALADGTRLKIIKLLSKREHSVDELVQLLSVAQSTTSHHLRVLKEAGLIRGEKRGRNIHYSLAQPLEEFQDDRPSATDDRETDKIWNR